MRNLHQTSFLIHYTAVFFNLFAAAEPSQMFALLVEPYEMIQVSILL